MPSELQKVTTRPAANLEHPFAPVVSQLGGLIQPGINGIALFLSTEKRSPVPMIHGELC